MVKKWFKTLIKKTQTKANVVPRAEVERAEVPKAKINMIEYFMDDSKKKLTRIRYNDTGEIVEVDLNDMKVFENMMTCNRPVTILGFVH